MKIKNLKLKIIFFGSSSNVLPILEVLRKNFDLKLVLTTEKSGGAVPSYCSKNKLKCISVSSLSDPNLKSLIINLKSPVAVLADFGLIIPDKILNIFPKGVINIHPSLLPKYRGPTPVQNAILNGDKITGVSIMKLDDKIDHGPLLAQEKEEILDTDTAESLYKRLFTKGANLLPKAITSYLNGNLKLMAQNHTKATFTKPLTRTDGFIDISELKIKNSLKIENLKLKIRAYYPWPGVWTRLHLGGGRLKQDGSHDSSEVKEKIVKFLPEGKLQVEGKKPMSYKDFLNGYPDAREILNYK